MYKLKLGLPEHKAFQDAMYHVPMKRKLELIQAKFFFMLFSAYENGGLNSARELMPITIGSVRSYAIDCASDTEASFISFYLISPPQST